MDISGTEIRDDSPLVYVVQAEAKPVVMRVENNSRGIQKSHWQGFVAGLICTALVGCAGLWGWHALHQEPVLNTLLATVQPLPKTLTAEQITSLRTDRADKLPTLTNEMLAATQTQLDSLKQLPAMWPLNYGSQLVKQAQTLWPQIPEVEQLAAKWQLSLNAQAASNETLNDWNLAQTRLQHLANKLNGLDEQRGKYITVSELKSSVFAIQQPLAKSPPLEELLRQLAEQQNAGKVAPALMMQIDNRFKQLQSRYMLLTESKTE
jgi:type VI secretion system protein VasL